MSESDARKAALQVLLTWQKTGTFPDQLLREYWDEHPHGKAVDRNLSYQLVFGLLRWQGKLDWIIGQLVKRPLEKLSLPVLFILRLGVFQILHLSRIPASAAVNESVRLVKESREPWAADFVNAVLRTLCRKKESLSFPGREDPLSYLAVNLSYPTWLVEEWMRQWGWDKTEALCRFHNEIPPLTLRVNTLKISRADLLKTWKDLDARPTPYAPAGIRLKDPDRPLMEWPAYAQGLFQIQDEASQMIPLLLDPQPGETVLDLCAGAGGKAAQLGELMRNRGKVVAVDIHPPKIKALQENARRLGVSIIEARSGDGLREDLFPKGRPLFDRILVDAPCSGWGVINRNPDLKWRLKPEDGPRMAERQNKFLQNAARWLKSGGVLLYATCTLNRLENQEVVARFLGDHPEFIPEGLGTFLPQTARDLADEAGWFQTWPPVHRMDGFFAARLRKR